MTGEKSISVNSVLPLNARTGRIAAGGGLAASAHDVPDCRCSAAGYEPDCLDFVMPHASESRTAASFSVPGPSFQANPVPNDNPT